MLKLVATCAAFVAIVCEAKIPIPGLEDLPKCNPTDGECIKRSANAVVSVIAKGYEPFGIQTFDPARVADFQVKNDEYRLDYQIKNLVVTGLRNAKLVEHDFRVDADHATLTYESDFSLEFFETAVFKLDKPVVREGPISGQFVGVQTTFKVPTLKDNKDGTVYLNIGQEEFISVKMPNLPEFNKEQFSKFVDESTKPVIDNIQQNPNGFYFKFIEIVAKNAVAQLLEGKRVFFKHVPISEIFNN